MYEDQLKQFRARSIEKTLRAGLPAYIMDEGWGSAHRPPARKPHPISPRTRVRKLRANADL